MASTYDSGVYGTATYDGVSVGNPVVELYINGAWVNVTSYVRVAEGIRIQRGRQDWSSSPTFATCDLTVDNRDGRFTPRNTAGAYYPYLVRNTPLRVSVYNDAGATTVRFWGDVAEWPVTVVGFGADITTTIHAAGLRRRLQSGAVPLQSPYRIAAGALTPMLGYWPMEDGAGTTLFASVTPNVGPLSVATTGTVEPAASDTFSAASTALPTFSGDQAGFTATVPAYTPSVTGQQVRLLIECDATAGDGVDIVYNTSGAHYFVFEYVPATNSATFSMLNYASGAVEYTSGTWNPSQLITSGVRFSVELKQNGTGIDWTVGYHGITATFTSFLNGTVPSSTLGFLTSVQVRNGGASTVTTVGHLTVENHITPGYDLAAVLRGFSGETAADRATRLAGYTGIAAIVTGAHAGMTTEPMGPQGEDTFLELFDECAFVDGGLSTEDVATRSLRFRARSDMYSQSATFNLSLLSLTDLSGVDDDQATVNDVTVTRTNGGSARYMVTSGNLSIASIGDYAQQVDLNVSSDTQLPQQAAWRAGLGTIDEPRWVNVTFDALRLTSGKRTNLIAQREGDLMGITSMSTLLGPAGSNLATVAGWTETITDCTWEFVFNTVPGTPYSTVFILDDVQYGRLDLNRLAL